MKVIIETAVDVESEYQAEDIAKIFKILVDKGALTGVKGGSTSIHFNAKAEFMGISFNYKPWWKGEEA